MFVYFGTPQAISVAPLVGAWIEILYARGVLAGSIVAPLVGAWIEIPPYGILPRC